MLRFEANSHGILPKDISFKGYFVNYSHRWRIARIGTPTTTMQNMDDVEMVDNPCSNKMGENVVPENEWERSARVREPGSKFSENTVSKVMCRPPILFIQFFNLLLACLLFYVFYLYTTGFQSWQTPLTSIFLILSFVFCLPFSTRFDVQDF